MTPKPGGSPAILDKAEPHSQPQSHVKIQSAKGQRSSKQTDASATSAKPKPVKKAKERKKANTGATQFKSKVIVRRLPPSLPESIFWKAVLPWIRDAGDCQSTTPDSAEIASTRPTVESKHYIAGKVKPDPNKQDRHSRAYIKFLDAASLVEFHKAFDGHIFRDSKGNESIAMVEFAPFQKAVVAKTKRKADPKQGTIDQDADYLAFVKKLEEDDAMTTEKKSDGELLAHLVAGKEKEKAEAAKKTTPLLEFLRATKAAKIEAASAAKKAKKADAKAAAAAASVSVPKTEKGKAKGAKADKGKKSAVLPEPVSVLTSDDKAAKPKPSKKSKHAGGKGKNSTPNVSTTKSDEKPQTSKPTKSSVADKKAGGGDSSTAAAHNKPSGGKTKSKPAAKKKVNATAPSTNNVQILPRDATDD